MKRHALRLLALVLAVPLVTCKGCVQGGPQDIRDLAAVDAPAAVLVSDLGAVARNLEAFLGGATGKAGAEPLRRIREGLNQQFGFDPLDPKALTGQGLDLAGGALAFGETSSPEPLLALAVDDRRLFDKSLKALIERTDGANKLSEEKSHGFTVVSAGRPFGTDVVPAFHWAHVGRFAIIAREEGKASLDAALTRLSAPPAATAAPTLRSDAAFIKLMGSVPAGEVTLFVRGNAATALAQSAATPGTRGAITSIHVDGKGIAADSYLDLGAAEFEKAMAGPPAADLANKIEGDAAFVLVSRAARADGVKALRSHPMLTTAIDRVVQQFRSATGVDPEAEVLPLLAGPLTLSVHIVDLKGLPQQMKTQRSISAVLDFFHLAVTAEVTDPKAFEGVLLRSRERLLKQGIKLRQRSRAFGSGKATIFEPDRPDPKLGWAIAGNHYVYGAGTGRLDRVLDLLAAGKSELPARLMGSVAAELMAAPGTTVMVLRAGQVADAASALAAGGPTAGAGALIGTALQLLRTLGDVALAVSAEPEGLRIKVREHLQ